MSVIKSLTAKSLLSALVPMALVLTIVALIASYVYERVAQDIVEQRDTELARVSAARLSEGLSRYSQLLQGIAAGDDARSMEPARLALALEDAQDLRYVFDAGIAVYDSEGLALAPRQGMDFPVPSKLDEMRRTLRPVYSDIFADAASGQDVILIGAPIVGSGGEFEGALAGMCTLKYSLLGSMYAQILELKAGRSGYAYLVDGNGRVIYHRYSSQVGGSRADIDPVKRVMRGETGAVLTEDAAGETIVSGFAPAPGTGWGLVTQERWDVVMGPIRRYSVLLLGMLIGGSVISGALVFFSISRVLRPIRDLTRGAERIAGGDFDYTVVVKTGDEIETLARQFNAMADALKDAFARLEHLNLVLRAVRNVNQLITREKDRDRLLKSACDNLIETSGYYSAWGALLDEAGGLAPAAEAGLGEDFLPLIEQLERGELTACGRRALSQPGVVVITVDPLSACAGCPLAMDCDGRGAMTVRLEHEGKVYGLLSVSIPADFTADEEERDLFQEVAGDVAFALHTIELEEERQRAEEALQKRTEEIELLYKAGRQIGQTLNMEIIYRRLYDWVANSMDCDALFISSYDPEEELIRCNFAITEGNQLDTSQFPPIPLETEGQGTQSVVIRTGEPMRIRDYQARIETAATVYHVDEEGTIVGRDQVPRDEDVTRSALIIPVKLEGKVVGVIQMMSYRLDAYTESDVRILESLASQIAVAGNNALLYQQAQDEITQRKQAEEELRKHRDHLEELVAERTAELDRRVTEVEQLNRGMTNLLEDVQTTNRNLERMAARLQEVNQELADFAYVVSHDLKAPLRGIRQLADWFSSDYGDALDEEGQEMLALLTGRTQRMHDLIDGILQYSRVGRVTENETSQDLNLLVQETVEDLDPPGHIQITVKDQLPTVVGERTRLWQVFQNLLGNAIKFMDKPQGRISVGCVDEGTHWRFSVTDNGPGIEEQHYDKVFQMFQTLAPRDEFESTGVGLALVKKIVEGWGGSIWLESTVGQGSTFFFTLPKKGEQNEEP